MNNQSVERYVDVRKEIMLGDLIERVEKIDPDAAQWMRLNSAKCNRSGRLHSAFAWDDTPQGAVYWRKIAEELGEPFPWKL